MKGAAALVLIVLIVAGPLFQAPLSATAAQDDLPVEFDYSRFPGSDEMWCAGVMVNTTQDDDRNWWDRLRDGFVTGAGAFAGFFGVGGWYDLRSDWHPEYPGFYIRCTFPDIDSGGPETGTRILNGSGAHQTGRLAYKTKASNGNVISYQTQIWHDDYETAPELNSRCVISAMALPEPKPWPRVLNNRVDIVCQLKDVFPPFDRDPICIAFVELMFEKEPDEPQISRRVNSPAHSAGSGQFDELINADEDCLPFVKNGVPDQWTTPHWVPGGTPPWVHFEGCEGLTVMGEDISDEIMSVNQQVPLRIGPINPGNPPKPQHVEVFGLERVDVSVPETKVADLHWPNNRNFSYTVTEGNLDQYKWKFRLRCIDEDGKVSQRVVSYDETGRGGQSTGKQDTFDYQACISASPDIELNPSSWVPALVERLKCLAQLLFVPQTSLRAHIAGARSQLYGGVMGAGLELMRSPWVAIRDVPQQGPSQVEFAGRMVEFPQFEDSVVIDRVKLSMTALFWIAISLHWFRLVNWATGIKARGEDMIPGGR